MLYLPLLPTTENKNNWIELAHRWPDLKPVANAPYKAVFTDGTVQTGKLDNKGHARIENVPGGLAKTHFGEDARPYVPAPVTPMAITDDSLSADVEKLGFNPAHVDIAAMLRELSGRTG